MRLPRGEIASLRLAVPVTSCDSLFAAANFSSLQVKQAIAMINLLLILIDLVVGKHVETFAGQSLEWLLAATVMSFHISFVDDLSGARLVLIIPTGLDDYQPQPDGMEVGLLPGS